MTALALGLFGAGLTMLWSMHAYQRHAVTAAAALVESPAAPTGMRQRPDRVRECSAPVPSDPRAGRVRAVLQVPALSLTAPVLDGTEDSSLDVGVGHLDTSRWPDQGGTDVLEAHDVTFFKNLSRLRPGDELTLTAPCRHWTYRVVEGRVVEAGAPVAASTDPRLVLVTCWPSDALFYTNQRYVVSANLVDAGVAATALPPLPLGPHLRPQLPPALVRADLSVDTVGIPLGRLHLDPRFAAVWQQSDRAFEASQAATHLLVVATRAVRGEPGLWPVVAPTVPMPGRARDLRWSDPVTVTVTGSGLAVTGAELTGGGWAGAPGFRHHYAVTVTTTVSHGVMTITGWRMVR